jgi:type I restriction enzyme M protein
LNKNKPAELKDKIFLINASNEFVKGDPKNYISDEQITKIAEIYHAKKEIEKFSLFVSKDDIVKNDYNISPSRYIHLGVAEEYKPIETILVELAEVEEKAKEADLNLKKVLKELGY